jgi:fatty-acyl-CoA synthase
MAARTPSRPAPQLCAPATSLLYNAEVSAHRYPQKPFLVFYGASVSFREFLREVEQLAGFLEREWGVRKGDRVILCMQNCPQFVTAYYGILRADAVVVPVNPMSTTEDIARLVEDCGARVAVLAQELFERIEPLIGRDPGFEQVLIAAYSDHVGAASEVPVPAEIAAARLELTGHGVSLWSRMRSAALKPGPHTSAPDDLCVMPYTSGTTGTPRGCMHTHRNAMHTLVGGARWVGLQPETTLLAVAPFFHVMGMQGSMSAPLFEGNTVVLLPRWNREAAAALIERYRIGAFQAAPTMVQDFFSNPKLGEHDISSLTRMSGGGAAMPAAIAERLEQLGIPYIEGYGLTETMSPSHINPLARPKRQCLGVPIYDVDSRIIDPHTLEELPVGEVGEIVTHAPNLYLGYWNKPEETARASLTLDGKRFLRTGDLGRIDEDGYFFMVDRLKRMINASGFKVWPAEVETHMYRHAAILEACVIAARDAHRGETVKALIVPRPEWRGRVTERDIIDWCRSTMAAYKAPRIVEFREVLPKSAAGKILWRELQERELDEHGR